MRIELSNDRHDRPNDPVKTRQGVFAELKPQEMSPKEAKRLIPEHTLITEKPRSESWSAKAILKSLSKLYKGR